MQNFLVAKNFTTLDAATATASATATTTAFKIYFHTSSKIKRGQRTLFNYSLTFTHNLAWLGTSKATFMPHSRCCHRAFKFCSAVSVFECVCVYECLCMQHGPKVHFYGFIFRISFVSLSLAKN